MGRILAIDYGLRRTGLAWTDPEQRVALPLPTVQTDQLWMHLATLCTEVQAIIVGYPRRLDGRPTELTGPVEAFAAEWQKRYPHIPLTLVEERLSTQAAHRQVQYLPRRTRRDKGLYDQITATLLLQNYLLRHKPL